MNEVALGRDWEGGGGRRERETLLVHGTPLLRVDGPSPNGCLETCLSYSRIAPDTP